MEKSCRFAQIDRKPTIVSCVRGLNRVQPYRKLRLIPAFVLDAAVHARQFHSDCCRYLRHLREIRKSRTERMEEKRKHPRTEIEEPAYVSSGGSVMRCVVRNISPEGAAIDVENPAFVPQRFRLVMAKDSSIIHECRIAWIKQNRIGLTFIVDVAQGTQR
jgi:hypothetical protein